MAINPYSNTLQISVTFSSHSNVYLVPLPQRTAEFYRNPLAPSSEILQGQNFDLNSLAVDSPSSAADSKESTSKAHRDLLSILHHPFNACGIEFIGPRKLLVIGRGGEWMSFGMDGRLLEKSSRLYEDSECGADLSQLEDLQNETGGGDFDDFTLVTATTLSTTNAPKNASKGWLCAVRLLDETLVVGSVCGKSNDCCVVWVLCANVAAQTTESIVKPTNRNAESI